MDFIYIKEIAHYNGEIHCYSHAIDIYMVEIVCNRCEIETYAEEIAIYTEEIGTDTAEINIDKQEMHSYGSANRGHMEEIHFDRVAKRFYIDSIDFHGVTCDFARYYFFAWTLQFSLDLVSFSARCECLWTHVHRITLL